MLPMNRFMNMISLGGFGYRYLRHGVRSWWREFIQFGQKKMLRSDDKYTIADVLQHSIADTSRLLGEWVPELHEPYGERLGHNVLLKVDIIGLSAKHSLVWEDTDLYKYEAWKTVTRTFCG